MKFTKKHIALTAVNLAVLVVSCILTVVGGNMADGQSYNMAGERWKNNSRENFSQTSIFLSEDSGFNIDTLNAVRSGLVKTLQDASFETEDGKLPFADAYSTEIGCVNIRCDMSGRSDAELTATGGDFFLFRDFRLIDGAFYSDDDIMQDGAVIDKSLAWSLYGSCEVSGMNIYIDGVKFYISGVIENPQTKAEKKCTGSMPKIYISYKGMSELSALSADSHNTENNSKKITCYETVLPDPVENFAYNAVKSQFSETYKGKYSSVKNSGRFSPQKRAKAFKKISEYAIIKNSIDYPCWENASRLVEFKLSFIYFFRNIILAVPILTLVYIMAKLVRPMWKLKNRVIRAVSIFKDRRRRDIINRFKKKSL